MITLQDILVFAKSKKACESQLKAFTTFLESGDELSAWQTVLGNVVWLRDKNLEIEQTFLEEKAQGIGKSWFSNGQLCYSRTYKEGELNGLCQTWHISGQLDGSRTYKKGKVDSLYQIWYDNGQLAISCTYKNGIIVT